MNNLLRHTVGGDMGGDMGGNMGGDMGGDMGGGGLTPVVNPLLRHTMGGGGLTGSRRIQ